MVKNLIVFDLDGTLAESKSEMDSEMSLLLQELLKIKSVAVMSGGKYQQFQKQFLKSLNCEEHLLKKLFLFPTCATQFYKYEDDWIKVYSEELSKEEKEKIINSFHKVFKDINYQMPKEIHGEMLEDRLSQITFSALGQQAPIKEKKNWDPQQTKRKKITKALTNYLPEMEIKIGGTTSIDVTKKGIDKAYGIRQIEKYLKFKKQEMLFIGDALYKGGNDEPVKKEGVDCIAIKTLEDTKQIIKSIIENQII